MIKDNPVRLYCPLLGREETVFIHTLTYPETNLPPVFNGCNSSYHACDACEACKKKALELFSR